MIAFLKPNCSTTIPPTLGPRKFPNESKAIHNPDINWYVLVFSSKPFWVADFSALVNDDTKIKESKNPYKLSPIKVIVVVGSTGINGSGPIIRSVMIRPKLPVIERSVGLEILSPMYPTSTVLVK